MTSRKNALTMVYMDKNLSGIVVSWWKGEYKLRGNMLNEMLLVGYYFLLVLRV